MPAGVAVLERLGLREAVGGLPLRQVRYHGFGPRAEAAFPTRDGRRPSRGAAPAAPRRDLLAAARATPNVRVFEEAPVEGAVVEQGRAVGLRVGGELRRAGLVVGADGIGSAVRGSLGLDRDRRRRDGSASGCTSAWRSRARPDRDLRRQGLRALCTPLPDGELGLAALCPAGALTTARAPPS